MRGEGARPRDACRMLEVWAGGVGRSQPLLTWVWIWGIEESIPPAPSPQLWPFTLYP